MKINILKYYLDGNKTKVIYECNEKIEFQNDNKKLSSKTTKLYETIKVASIEGNYSELDFILKDGITHKIYLNDKTNLFKFNSISCIGIQSIKFTGLKNPAFLVQGTTTIDEPIFKIYADEKEVEYTNVPVQDIKSFLLKAAIPRQTKGVTFSVIINGEEIVILRTKNRLHKRIKSKLNSTILSSVGKFKTFIRVMIKGIKFLWREHHFLVPPRFWKKYFKRFIYRMRNLTDEYYNPMLIGDYNKWLEVFKMDEKIEHLEYNPLISVLIPVYNVAGKLLNECVESVLSQTYQNFEICLVDDASTNEETKNALKELEKKDKRIRVKYREKNGHISESTNDALKMAKGEFIALVDNDDTISENALYENVLLLQSHKDADFIYSDEDKIDTKGKLCYPHFKPDFSPTTLMSLNYICHFSVIRKSIVEKVGGFEVGLEGAQDHDLFLKISEITNNIYHIPKILYHWRMIETSTSMNMKNKDYAADKGKIAIENALKRRKLNGVVKKDDLSGYYIVDYKLKKEPLVSIIIPTRDYAETLDTCLKSVYEKTEYKNFEIIVVNNNSEKEETFKLFEKYKKEHKNFKVLDANIEFNYSKINNMAVEISKGDYICLLNNDTEIISENWLSTLVAYASLPYAGAVGPKLLYPDDTVQHAGVILGLGGVASHAYLGADLNDLGLYGRLRVPYNYGAVTAACLVVKKSKYNEVNGLEEELKVAYNDVDFNIKLLKKGYYNICTPQVMLHHFESKSRGLDTTSEKYKRFQQESKYMYDKWEEALELDRFYNKNFSQNAWFLLDKKKRKK